MKPRRPRLPGAILLALLPLGAVACESNPENSAACGFTHVAGASMILQSLNNISQLVTEPPAQLPAVLPARVVGYGTSRVVVADGPEGLILGYEGQGFPGVPGFGLLLVDDSSEALRGVLIYEPEGPSGYPELGTVSGTGNTIPLYGVRIHWPSVNTPRCPLFAPTVTDTGTTPR